MLAVERARATADVRVVRSVGFGGRQRHEVEEARGFPS